MNFQKRIFITVASFSTALILLVAVAAYVVKYKENQNEFRHSYAALMENFKVAFELLDKNVDQNMLTAAKYIREFGIHKGDKRKNIELAHSLGISGIELI